MKTNFYLLLLLALFMVSCGGSGSDVPAAEESGDELPVLTDMSADDYSAIVKRYNDEGKAVLVNIWATWCGPCVEEFPHIVELQKKYRDDLQVVFISADFEEDREATVQFLKDQGVDWETYFKTGTDEPFINAIETQWGGALPFTKIYTAGGEITSFWENKADMEKFEKAILEAVNPNSN